MIDYNDPSPWIMTTLEKCGFIAGLLGIAWTALQDFLRKRSAKS
jgi:hypothetical protein